MSDLRRQAAQRLADLDRLPATELCSAAEAALNGVVAVMNAETTLLRAGRMKEASALTAEKARLAQDYVGLARSIQRQAARLQEEAPQALDRLRSGHERLATQMAENLRVIATARRVTEDILGDVAKSVAQTERPKTYGATGGLRQEPVSAARGIAINRAL